ncbi:MAG TPA: HAD-IA family hydrolase [Actinomycetota bacterium]|nr:HAD-IA family hydrolase [Actinomycetota bacterium]
MDFRGVFFDVGDTLLAPHPSFLELFARILGEHGYPLMPAQVEEALHAVGRSVAEVIAQSGDQRWSTSREKSRAFWRRLYGAMLDHRGIPDPDGAIFESLYGRFTSYESYRLFPDVLPALEACRRAGLTLAVVSNFEEWLEGMLIEFEVAPFFACLVISGREGVEKPDPAIFKLALDRTGLQARDVAFVGDHPTVDVAAANELGMTGVLVDRWDRYAGFAGPRVRDLLGLLPFLGLHPPA